MLQRFRPLAQDDEVAVVGKNAMAFLARNLPGDVQFLRALLSIPTAMSAHTPAPPGSVRSSRSGIAHIGSSEK